MRRYGIVASANRRRSAVRTFCIVLLFTICSTLSAHAAGRGDAWRCYKGNTMRGIEVQTCALAGRFTSDRIPITRIIFHSKHRTPIELRVLSCVIKQGRTTRSLRQFAYHLSKEESVVKSVPFRMNPYRPIRTHCELRINRPRSLKHF